MTPRLLASAAAGSVPFSEVGKRGERRKKRIVARGGEDDEFPFGSVELRYLRDVQVEISRTLK